MQESVAIHIPIAYSEIAAFCARWKIVELALFGSVLREDFSPASDIDVLFVRRGNQRHTWTELVKMKAELEQLFKRPVDLIPKKAVEEDSNYLRRNAILSSAQVIYAER